MGEIILPMCNSCDEVFLPIICGGGEMNFMEVATAPYYCDNCSTLVSSNILDEKHPCETCGKELVMYGKLRGYFDDEELDENGAQIIYYEPNRILFEWTIAMDLEYIIEDIDYHCPKCKNESLRFYANGMWD